MHIVHCLSRGTIGGGPAMVYLLATGLKERFPDVRQTIILPLAGPYGERFRSAGFPVIEVGLDRIAIGVQSKLSGHLRALRPDVVHSHGKGAGLYARWSRPNGMRSSFVHSYHGFHLPQYAPFRWNYLLLERYLARHSDAVVPVSPTEAGEVAALLHPRNLRLIENCIDTERLNADAKQAMTPAANSFFARNADRLKVAFIGRNDPAKDIPLAVKTMELLIQQGSRIAALFAGTDADDAVFDPLRKHTDRVLLAGAVETAAPILHASDVLLITSTKEGMPLVVLEAFALGKPVVGTNVQGIADLVTANVNGLLASNAPGLAAHLEALSSDADLLAKLAAAARAADAQRSYDSWLGAYYQLYQEVSGRG